MKKGFTETSLGIGIAIALFLGGMACAQIVNQVKVGNFGDAATWTGATLAGLAFGGTIWIARNEGRERRRQRHILAHVTAISMFYETADALKVLEAVVNTLEPFKTMDAGPHRLQNSKELMSEVRIWTVEDIVPLAEFDVNVAAILTHSAKQLSIAKQVSSDFHIYEKPDAPRKAAAQRFIHLMELTMKNIRRARVELEKYQGVNPELA